jgi:radical SAM protein with 4Fe4S-binding SPASM domain
METSAESMSYVQEPPFAIQIEFVEGCNLRCDFCAVQGIQEKQGKGYKFMEQDTSYVLAKEISRLGWKSRIEFAMHGEPTLHPYGVGLIERFRYFLPHNQLMMTSNGVGLLPDPYYRLKALFDAGLNVFAFDAYESVKIHEKIAVGLGLDGSDMESGREFQVGYYPDEPLFNPHKRRPSGTRLFIWLRDISKATHGTHANLTNQGGTAAPPDYSREGQRCAKPFRELSIRWDGNIAGCCDDWRGVYKCGNVMQTPLDEIWNGPAFDAMRHYLIVGARGNLEPCNGCNVRTNRLGLLPDKYGRVKLSLPTSQHATDAVAAITGQPYSAPVLRQWELTQLGRK